MTAATKVTSMRTLPVALAFLSVLLFAVQARAQDEPPHSHGAHAHHLGTVVFPTSGAAAAQQPFLRGVALLHSFEYEDAADALREAQAADPDFALAYWLEAITNSKLLWGREDTVQARAVLRRLGPTAEARLARAGTDRERAWGAAVEALYVDADVQTRARAYAESLRAVAASDPTDHEAAAFASIALQMAELVGAYERSERAAIRREAIALADRVYRANREHPGATHYLIHAYDDPEMAEQGLEFARAYAQIAPDAQHALHMPSHIFVQIGLWDDAVASNERAWAASRQWVERRHGTAVELDFHSLEWLQHGYLQQGRYRAALALIDTVHAVLRGADVSNSVDPQFVAQRLAFRYAAEARDWSRPLPRPPVIAAADGAQTRYASFSFMALYQDAVGAVLQGDTMAPAITEFRSVVSERSGGQPSRGFLAVTNLHVDALLASARGDRAAAIALLERAAEVEDEISPVGPPTVLPSLEWLGDLLLATDRAADASDAYKRALARWPNRPRSLIGLARARHAVGDVDGSFSTWRKLREAWHAADAELPELAQARGAAR
jgi:tetratricopeptide (TPR) repeat protein